MERILRDNNFTLVRQNGSHKIWQDGLRTVSVPSVKLKSVVAIKLIKNFNLHG